MSISEQYERTVGTMTLETTVYEDGHVQSTLLDSLGLEVASLDGTARDGNTSNTRSLVEGYLLDQNYND